MGEQLKILLEILDLKQNQFAKSVDISPSHVSDILTGRRNGFSTEVIIKISELYNVNIHWLLTGEGEMFLTSPPSPLLKERGEEPSKVMQSNAGNGKQNGHLTGINGNVETYPEITSIEQIARTGWWANLTEDDRELYAINEELPHEATRRLRDAAEYEYLVNERRIEASDIKKTLRQKGEAG